MHLTYALAAAVRSGHSAGVRMDIGAFHMNGFVLVEEAVPKELYGEAVRVIETALGVEVGDPSSWYTRPRPFLDVVPVWGHPVLWAIRQVPALHQVWATLWGQQELLVAIDRCRFSPPWRPGEPDPLPLHWDHDPHDEFRYLQGLVALTNTGADQGGFRCLPGWHRGPGRWPDEPVDTPSGAEWLAPPEAEGEVGVPMKAGDLLVWSSRLPHANSKNTSDRPRLALYLHMFPWTEEEAAILRDCWSTGACHPAWRQLPGHDHLEPWAPVALSPLGRRLAGLDPW